MRKRNDVKKLGMKKARRKSVLKNQLDTLFTYGKLKTTSKKAKVTKVKALNLIANIKGIKDNVTLIRFLKRSLFVPASRENIIKYIAIEKQGINLVKTGFRGGDNSEVSELSLMNFSEIIKKPEKAEKKKKAVKAKETKIEKVEKTEEQKSTVKKENQTLGRKNFAQRIRETFTGTKERAKTRSGI